MMGFVLLVAVVVLLVGPVLGIIGYVRSRHVKEELLILRAELKDLRKAFWKLSKEVESGVPFRPESVEAPPFAAPEIKLPAEEPVFHPKIPSYPFVGQGEPEESSFEPVALPDGEPGAAAESASIPGEAGEEIPEPVATDAGETTPPWRPTGFPSTSPTPPRPLELTLGTKWLNWIGAVLLLIGVAYGIKYAYDNQWIGPKGRLAIGAVAGVIAMGLGERFRRKNWTVLFQTLTGIGLAIFYICIYFSFQVYKLSGQQMAFGLATGVTALAIALAVAHNALPIAVFAVVGGFMSPVLLSTGENHPYALFTYIAILDLVAIGAAYFRKWRELDVLCFLGTIVLYAGWYQKYAAGDLPNQMEPALLYLSLFYVLFLVIPSLHSLVRKVDFMPEGPGFVFVNSIYALFFYYRMLYADHRWSLGFVVIAQALLVFVLFQAWVRRVGAGGSTPQSLLIITLALVTLAVPLHLKTHGIPIAWGVEGAVLAWLGVRYRQVFVRLGSVVALACAVGNLLTRLPLHAAYFTPVFNMPFLSWTLVSASALAAAWVLRPRAEKGPEFDQFFALAAFILGFATACVMLSLETSDFWRVRITMGALATDAYRPEFAVYRWCSLVVLWALIPTATTVALSRLGVLRGPWVSLQTACYLVGFGMFFVGLSSYRLGGTWLFANAVFPSFLAFPVALWIAAVMCWNRGERSAWTIFETGGHILLAILLALEIRRWDAASDLISSRVALSLISAVWALMAFSLILFGLVRRIRLRRILGFVLFGVTVAKVLAIDTSELDKAYRILSFIACGLLLVAASYFYQRFVHVLLEEKDRGDELGEPGKWTTDHTGGEGR
jgi:uncharacterized membrane protein